MDLAVNKLSLIKSNTWIYDPSKKVTVKFIIIDKTGASDGVELNTRREVLNEFMESDVMDEMKSQYIDCLEGNFNEDHFDDWCFEHFEEIAAELGYRVLEVLR